MNAVWFKMFDEIIQKCKIDKDCQYGCDETGFHIGMAHQQYVIESSEKKQQHKQQESDSHEAIITVITICADGTSIPPLVIFKGEAFSVKWAENNPLKASYVIVKLL